MDNVMDRNDADAKTIMEQGEEAKASTPAKTNVAVARPLPDLFDLLDDLFAAGSFSLSLPDMLALPRQQVEDRGNDLVATVYLPEGTRAENVTLEVVGRTLYVDARVEQWEGEGESSYLAGSSSFRSTTVLPEMVNVAQATAKLENGVLTVALPKSLEPVVKKIEVK